MMWFSYDWLVGLGLVVSGMLIGGLIVRVFFTDRDRERELREELAASREEFEHYRGEVRANFRATADAVNKMTESYRDVYEQLRRGAQHLCGEGEEPRLLSLLAEAEPARQEQHGQPEPAQVTWHNAIGTGASAEMPDDEQAPDADAAAMDTAEADPAQCGSPEDAEQGDEERNAASN